MELVYGLTFNPANTYATQVTHLGLDRIARSLADLRGLVQAQTDTLRELAEDANRRTERRDTVALYTREFEHRGFSPLEAASRGEQATVRSLARSAAWEGLDRVEAFALRDSILEAGLELRDFIRNGRRDWGFWQNVKWTTRQADNDRAIKRLDKANDPELGTGLATCAALVAPVILAQYYAMLSDCILNELDRALAGGAVFTEEVDELTFPETFFWKYHQRVVSPVLDCIDASLFQVQGQQRLLDSAAPNDLLIDPSSLLTLDSDGTLSPWQQVQSQLALLESMFLYPAIMLLKDQQTSESARSDISGMSTAEHAEAALEVCFGWLRIVERGQVAETNSLGTAARNLGNATAVGELLTYILLQLKETPNLTRAQRVFPARYAYFAADTLDSLGENGLAERVRSLLASMGSVSSLGTLTWNAVLTGNHQVGREYFESYSRAASEFAEEVSHSDPSIANYERLEWANCRSNDALNQLALGAPADTVIGVWLDPASTGHLESHFYPAILHARAGDDRAADMVIASLSTEERERMASILTGGTRAQSPWFNAWCRDGLELLNQ